MLHQFYLYTIDLENYQTRYLPPTLMPYKLEFEQELKRGIRRFQAELHWEDMWDIPTANRRLGEGYRFVVFRPDCGVRGWAWLTPKYEIKNVYVYKTYRGLGWGKNLYYYLLNEAWALEYPFVTVRVDIWNVSAMKVVEKVAEVTGCGLDLKLVEEEYVRD